MPVISNAPSDTQPLSRIEDFPVGALTNIAEEIGVEDFFDRSPVDRPFAPTMEHGLGVLARERDYALNDPYICGHGIRRAASEEAKRDFPHSKFKWHESLGILDLGGGLAGTIPLAAIDGGYVALYYGFFCSAMLRFRRLSLQRDNDTAKPFPLPITTALARQMPAGYEIEFVGQGRLNVGAGIAVGTGLAVGPFWAGVAGVAPVTNEGIKEYSITVTSIDGNGKMRLVIRKLDSVQTTAGILGAAGFISPGYNGIDLNGAGPDTLLVGNSSTVKATGMILDLSSASIGLAASHLEKSTVISAFEIDLNKEDAQNAYEDLLRLSPATAYRLASESNSAVQLLSIKERQTEFSTSGYVNILGDKIFSSERFDTERNGEMIRRDGSQLLYRNKIFEKRFTNYFSGKKYICWESISTKDSNEQKSDLFYHLKFERSDYEFVARRFQRFFEFGKALFIPEAEIKFSQGQSHNSFLNLTTKAAQVDSIFDIFFTKEGVEQIEACEEEVAAGQYIRAMSLLKSKFAGFPCDEDGFIDTTAKELLKEFAELSSERHAFGLGRFRERLHIRKAYLHLTGRKISVDAKLYHDAQQFGREVVSSAKERQSGQPEQLFSHLGQVKGFHYAGAIVALTRMAGRDNSVIQEMSLNSRGSKVGYNEDAIFKLPRELIFDELTAAA